MFCSHRDFCVVLLHNQHIFLHYNITWERWMTWNGIVLWREYWEAAMIFLSPHKNWTLKVPKWTRKHTFFTVTVYKCNQCRYPSHFYSLRVKLTLRSLLCIFSQLRHLTISTPRLWALGQIHHVSVSHHCYITGKDQPTTLHFSGFSLSVWTSHHDR